MDKDKFVGEIDKECRKNGEHKECFLHEKLLKKKIESIKDSYPEKYNKIKKHLKIIKEND